MVLSGEAEPGDKVLVEAESHELKFDVQKGGASREVAAWSEESEESEEALTPEHAATR
jgi:hypothetical protein